MPKCDSIETTLRHRCSPVNLLHIFSKAFTKNTLGGCFWPVHVKNSTNTRLRHFFLNISIIIIVSTFLVLPKRYDITTTSNREKEILDSLKQLFVGAL